VLAGPTEATAIGNILVQAMGAGVLTSRADARRLVRLSFPIQAVEPRSTAAWDRAYRKYREMTSG
jgi:rhamnulokinase